MNWKEFVEKAKASGVQDGDVIDYIDISSGWDFEFFRSKIQRLDGSESEEYHLEVH